MSACAHTNSNSENASFKALSLNTIMATPEAYDKKTIVVEGYIHSIGVDIDETGFYSFFPTTNKLNEDGVPICELDYELFISKDELPRRLRYADRQKVVISGRFNNTKLNHQTSLFLHELVGSFDDVSLLRKTKQQCVPH